MNRLVIWGAYPSTLDSVRRGMAHMAGLGDDLLWWIAPTFEHLRQQGYEILWGDEAVSCLVANLTDAALILLDIPSNRCGVANALFERIPISRRLLMRLEPPPIAPRSYLSGELRKYGGLLRVEPGEADGVVRASADFLVPAPAPVSGDDRGDGIQGRVVAVSSNKVIAGPRGKLYRLRERAYRELASCSGGFDLFGQGWTRRRTGLDLLDRAFDRLGVAFPLNAEKRYGYRGKLDSKAAIGNYQYSLVIENYLGTTYLSEKIFDSLKYGVIPVYVGGVDTKELGLGEIVCQIAPDADFARVAAGLPRPPSRDDIRASYAAWLSSDIGRRFSVRSAAATVHATLSKFAP